MCDRVGAHQLRAFVEIATLAESVEQALAGAKENRRNREVELVDKARP